jgi:plastocyanin
VKAGEPFTITLKNSDDPGVLHDVDIRERNGTTVVVDQKTTDGGQTSEYEYPKLEAGEYVFICSIHPIPLMTGKLTVN